MVEADVQTMKSVLELQRAAFVGELPVSAASRRDRLQRAVQMIVDHGAAFVQAMSEDFGHRSTQQSMLGDINGSIRALKGAIHHLDDWMKPERRALPLPLRLMGAKAAVEYQPKGVIGIIGPWNFPVTLVLDPLSGVLAAGNRAMIKSSEYTPTVAALFESVAPQYFDTSEVAFFSGGPETGQAFAQLPFDHLMFTGATNVGKHILRAAADNLVPVTLELGGKSPSIIGRSADLARATQRIAMAKMMNSGQICLAPDYLLAPEEHEAAVINGVTRAVARMYPTLLDNPDYTSVVNARHRDRLNGYLEDARAHGGEVIEINPAGEDFSSSNGNKMPLYIVRHPTDAMKVMQEEIFGPILPIKTYARIEQAIGYVNAHDRPLALYYYGADKAEERQVLDRTISGGVTVNDAVVHTAMETLPFGGIGPSGMGHYHGQDGFRTFSHAKAVFHQTRFDVAKMIGMLPPYGKQTDAAIARDFKP